MNLIKKTLGIMFLVMAIMLFIVVGYNPECNNPGYFIAALVLVLVLQYISYQEVDEK